MAVKITRQPNKIALIGAPVSAGAHNAGPDKAPQALRTAGLVARLTAAGFEVNDMGDIATFAFAPDEESPRARNIRAVADASVALKTPVELATKSGALPLIVGGDCTIALGVIAGVKRYFPHVGLIYCDGDADLNTPATTPSGFLEGMVVAHIAGKGSPELVRITTDPPLVREPDIALFGTARLDPGEEKFLVQSPMRKYPTEEVAASGAATVAQRLLDRIQHGNKQLILHFDVDVISSAEFPATNFGAENGLSFEQTRAAFDVFCGAANLAAVIVTEYVPEKDPDASAAKKLIDLLAGSLAKRIAPGVASTGEAARAETVPHDAAPVEPPSNPAAQSELAPNQDAAQDTPVEETKDVTA